MNKFITMRAVVTATALAFCCLSLTAVSFNRSLPDKTVTPLNDGSSSLNQQKTVERVGTYYSLREDRRRCASPMCGGYFIKRINQLLTQCSDRKYQSECYVAEIDWNGEKQVAANGAILRGTLQARTYRAKARLGVLRVTESWEAASNNEANNRYYRVIDRGVRCITQPCPTYQETELNTRTTKNIAGIDLNSAGADEAVVQKSLADMSGPDGVIVSGTHVSVRGPGGKSFTLKADQFYLKSKSSPETQPSSPKPGKGVLKQCIRTGCSNQICADQEMVTTCEYKPEYDCYRQARCERQTNGSCGFTPTPELAACLKKR